MPGHVLGGPRHVPPNEKINLAYIGCGTQGFRQLTQALQSSDINVVAVCDPVRDTARETGVVTQLFRAAGQTSTPTLCEWIWGGAIGPVREVHNWSTRPFWPQGMTDLPSERPGIPEGFDWDAWLGPAPMRPYKKDTYHTFKWRGWKDFGTGALGDMA